MKLSALATLVAAAEALPQFGGGQSYTMLRFGCAQTVIDRIDPLVNPGVAPSPHMHQVAGGNAFNITMASTDISKLATCTTCGYSEDVRKAWHTHPSCDGDIGRAWAVPICSSFGLADSKI